MSKLVETYVERYIKRHHNKIRQICDPLQRFFGINYFTYHSITPDGLWRPIVSRPDWADFYARDQLYLYDPMLLHPRCYQSGSVLWSQHLQEPYQKEILKTASEKFEMDHGFCIMERTEEGCDFFGFSAPPSHKKIYSTYLNDLPLLKEFCKYFKHEVLPILKLVDQDPIDLLALRGNDFLDAHGSPFEDANLTKSLFLQFITAQPLVKLTKREKECLSYYMDDFRMKDVAEKMGLSIRTIEFYLNNIKDKLDCNDKPELLKKGRELRSLGIIL